MFKGCVLGIILSILAIGYILPKSDIGSKNLSVSGNGQFEYTIAYSGAYWPLKILNYDHLKLNSGFNVVLTNTGFEPSVIVVNEGDTITFRSERETNFWPASDSHPTHDDYPGFDPGRPIRPGETWSFTFNKTGVWGYHDHLASSYSPDVALVEVFGKDVDISQIEPIRLFNNCADSSYGIRCWANVLRSKMVNEGIESAFDLLKKLYDTEPTFRDNCNDITHYFGGLSYEFFRDRKEDVVIPKSLYCGGGFYHGLIEVWFHDKPKIGDVNNFCNYVGDTLSDNKVLARQACFHGIGHGAYHLNLIDNWDDFASEVKKSFRVCEEIGEIPNCVNGVFVAVVTDYFQGRYGILNKKENPFKFCENLDEYKDACYRGFVSIFMRDSIDIADVFKSIKLINEKKYIKEAIATVMHVYAIKNSSVHDYEQVVGVCRGFQDVEQRQQCLSSYLRGLIDFGEPGTEHLPNFEFCKLAILTNEEVNFCRHNIIDYERDFLSREQFKIYCDSLTGVDQKYCLEKYNEN